MRNLKILSQNHHKRKSMAPWILSILMGVVLGLSNAQAFVGDAVGVDLTEVTCTNTTSGASGPGVAFPGGAYSCDAVPSQAGALVEVTLSGTATTDDSSCVDVMENAVAPPILPLTPGACFNLIGSIATGFGDINNPVPNFEVDAFVLLASDVTGVRLSLVGDEGVRYIALIADANEIAHLTCALTPESCRGDIAVELSGIGVAAIAPGAYVLELRVIAIEGGGMPVGQTAISGETAAAAVDGAIRQYLDR